MTDQQIASIRRWGYVQFFATSYLFHPTRLVRTIVNVLRGVEENKLERVGYEKLRSGGKLLRKLFGQAPAQPTAGRSTAA